MAENPSRAPARHPAAARVPDKAQAHAPDPAAARASPPAPDDAQVETLKALAAPIRLRILYTLTQAGQQSRVMSVKEIAAELGEPQTRLYRHVKVLESAGLIEVAATRLVSGIVEHRYRSSYRDLQLGPGLLRGAPAAAEAAVTSMAGVFTEQFFAAYRDGRVADADVPDSEAHRKPVLMAADARIPADRAARVRLKLQEIIDELSGPDDPDGVPVNALIGFYSPDETGSSQPP